MVIPSIKSIKMKKGLFFTFEGIDGCGKSTQLRLSTEYLKTKNIPHIVTREPGGTPLAEKVREIILSPQNDIKDRAEVLLYLASRAQHVEEKIIPAMEQGKIVLCDRFQEATFAYQGFGRGFLRETLEVLNNFSTDGLQPTRTFIFDVSLKCASERLKKTGKAPDRLEQNSLEFFSKVRQGFFSLAEIHSDRIHLINSEKPIDEIFEIVKKDINKYIDYGSI